LDGLQSRHPGETATYRDLVEDRYGPAVRLERSGSTARFSRQPYRRGGDRSTTALPGLGEQVLQLLTCTPPAG